MVVEDDADLVALIDLNGGPGRGAVEAPEVERLVGQDGLLYRLGDEVEDLRPVLEGEGKIGNVGGGHGDVACCSAAGTGQFKNGAGGAGVRAAAGGFVSEERRGGDQASTEPCTEAQGARKKAASIRTSITQRILHGVNFPAG